ncbi:TPA: restriction endonuclease subunit S [Vibrio parahaemolyticus]|uniref:restriction endonuclease subunit S n=1 Tax=Vibrio TaxID=662 RepID=UPI001EB468DC|nr:MULTISPECIES: restriction endonuclease subunit S [Vibrio]EGQ8539136.1 restriction endonuclease subunit S [Vibrio parahaemolyticus]MCS0170716.1 restriction endonuclease subunit S [Vibrio alginolyticus]MDW2022085.1 restriction endonuclease subunit S [Vibrio sp. 397]MDW2029131.1 restriction endonuclease subunit S [Vibrio sp. 399]MDW2213947.1 restriction endonuclease subunit S [Vibrio sp. 1982]
MVPNGWERNPIKDLCESIIDCVNKTAKHVEHVTPFKMIRTTNVRNGRVDTNNVRYVEEDTYKQWIRRGAPKDGDIIFTREAPVGEAGILENAQGIFLGQRTMMYRSNPERSDNRYLFYSLMSGYCQKQIEDFSNGGTVAHMRVPDCGELIINTPPLPEQQKIAQILSTWDQAISTTEKLIETSKQQKKNLMQQLLTGKKRLVDPETGEAFEGEWEEVELGKITSIYDGTHSTPKYVEKGIPFYSVEHLTRDDFSNTKFITEDVFEKENKRVKLERDDILMTRIGDIGTAKHLNWDVCASFYVSLALIKANKSKFDSAYMGYYINSHEFHRELYKRTIHVAFPKKINLGEINHCNVLLPSINEQQKIASVLTAADKEIEVLQAKLTHFKQEKKALMQQLLTGKRRVKVDKAEAA